MKLFDLIGVEGNLLKTARAFVGAHALFKDVLYNFVLFTLAHIKSMRQPAEKYTNFPLIKAYMGTNRIFRQKYILRKSGRYSRL